MDRARPCQIALEQWPDQTPDEAAPMTPGDSGAVQNAFDALLVDVEEFDWEQMITF